MGAKRQETARAETRGVPIRVHASWFLCIGWAGASASLLHLAPSRTEVAWIVPLAWAWGATAFLAAWWSREARPPVWPLVLLAIAVRAVFIGTPPLLSDDVYRYLWEGELLLSGGNPFLTPPAAVPGLDDPLRALVNHPDVPSAYPPLALLWFQLLRVLGGTVASAQAAAALADVGVVAALVALRRGRPVWPALLYALHPLAVLESAAGAHLDVPAVALLAAGLASTRPWVQAFLATLGAGVKVLPGTLLPGLSLRRGALLPTLGGAVLGLAVLGVASFQVVDAGPALLTGLTAYARHWSFNGLLFPWLTAIVDPPAARLVLVGAGGVVSLSATIALRRQPLALWLAIGALFVALSPTVHPWYGLWFLVPGLALGRGSAAVAGVALVGSYGVLSGYDAASGAWSEPGWLWPLTWVPVLLAVGVEVALAVRRRRASRAV